MRPRLHFTLAGGPLGRVSLRWRGVPGGRRLGLDQGLRALRPSVWLRAAPFPDKKENRHLAAVSGRFPEITGWHAGIPSFGNSTVLEAQTAVDRPVMPCALLRPSRKRQRLWM